jgi:beta-phosphoglucomutase-like phosphatase (HAD superfamily)
VVAGDTTPHAKPHPAPLLEAARRLGQLAPAACVYVGDDERDIVAGLGSRHAHGGRAPMGTSVAKADTLGWGADYFIDPFELMDLLKLLKLLTIWPKIAT